VSQRLTPERQGPKDATFCRGACAAERAGAAYFFMSTWLHVRQRWGRPARECRLWISSTDWNVARLESIERFRPLPEDTLVLPSHGKPFTGLQVRIDQLQQHYQGRLVAVPGADGVQRFSTV